MSIAVADSSFRVVELETRLPFHFGGVEVTAIPKVFLEVDATVDGVRQTGVSSGGLIPGWFFKDPEMDVTAGYREMVTAFERAADVARDLAPMPTPFAFWLALSDVVEATTAETAPDRSALLRSYGVSLVEQAVIDAACRAMDASFADAVRENALGIDLGSVYDELAPYEPADLLPSSPNRSTAVRHTVGLGDPLTSGDGEGDRPDDGLPVTLADYVRTDGVTHFKIKLSADEDRDATRLGRIAEVLADLEIDDYRCTIDANEGYESAREFVRQWESHATDPALAPLFDRLAYVEQPLPRDEAFTPETRDVFTEWEDGPPVIVDESDDDIGAAGTALKHGYAGTSHKNCKGVFKGIVNACLVTHRNRLDDGREYVISAEDLTTVGPVELLQDLAVAATIGADHVERNGHHYFCGLGGFPAKTREAVLSAHDDLYRRTDAGVPTLDISEGVVELDSVIDAPFGVGFDIDVSEFESLDSWLNGLDT